MRDLRLHDLRRTHGSWMAANGASLPMIGKALGHKNPSTTAIYARLNLDPVRLAVAQASTALMATAGSLIPPNAAANAAVAVSGPSVGSMKNEE